MNEEALGLIEVIGFTPAVEAADSALKAANIKLLRLFKVDGGIVTVALTGDVGAVKAAVAAGGEAAGRMGTVRTTHVIARLQPAVRQLLLTPEAPKGGAVRPEAAQRSDVHQRVAEVMAQIVPENLIPVPLETMVMPQIAAVLPPEMTVTGQVDTVPPPRTSTAAGRKNKKTTTGENSPAKS